MPVPWCALLDIVPPEPNAAELSRGLPAGQAGLAIQSPEVRNRIVRAGLAAAAKSRPAAFFTRSLERRIVTGNFEDDLKLCAEADWIIEAVAENLEIKRGLLARVAQVRKPGSHRYFYNTSGLPVRLIAEGLPDELAAAALGRDSLLQPAALSEARRNQCSRARDPSGSDWKPSAASVTAPSVRESS